MGDYKVRRRLPLLIRLTLSSILIFFLLWKIPFSQVLGALRHLSVFGLALSTLVIVAQQCVAMMRWRRMLSRTGAVVTERELMAHTLVGSAYNLILPSAIGGDFVRALRCARRLESPYHAWSTVLYERTIGVIALTLAALPGIALMPGARSLMLPALLICATAIAVLLFARRPLEWLAGVVLHRAPALALVSQGIAEDLAGPLATVGARSECFALSFVYQVLSVSILAACVLPSGNAHLLLAIYAGLPLIAIGSMLPVTIAGIGVRESLFVIVLGRLGVDPPTALALAVLWLASSLVLAAAGLGALLAEGEPSIDSIRA